MTGLLSLVTAIAGAMSPGLWNGEVKTDAETQLWWHHPLDGTYYYPVCQSEVKATQTANKFQLEKVGVYCKQGPYWNFEQELPPMELDIKGNDLYWNNKLAGRISDKTVKVEFMDKWDDEHYILLRHRMDDDGSYHYFNWSVVSSMYINFDLESYNLRPFSP